MSKLSAEAFVSLLALVDAGKTVQLEKRWQGDYEVTVWDDKRQLSHSHYNDDDLIKAVDKAKDH